MFNPSQFNPSDPDASLVPDVSIVMPCLNEARWLPVCIANAQEALDILQRELGLSGEILIADNGSTDGSPAIALSLGARVAHVSRRGYGAALIGGFCAARGRFLVMGDADGSYDFRQSLDLVRRLTEGADLCMGSRFKGGIEPGAMPWKNRYIGNPALTFVLNLFYGAGVSDAHCGLRALTRSCFETMGLTGAGMEFASEMIIKASLKGMRIAEAPVTLSRDLRDRAPHLRPWRDGWRHLRYLFMLSPVWAFAAPAGIAALGALAIFVLAAIGSFSPTPQDNFIGNYWTILAGSMLGLSHTAGLLAAAAYLYGCREGYRSPNWRDHRFARWISLDSMLIAGGVTILMGLAILGGVVAYWSQIGFQTISSVLPAVAGTTLVVIGAQNALGGFLLAILQGNEAQFLQAVEAQIEERQSVRDAQNEDGRASQARAA